MSAVEIEATAIEATKPAETDVSKIPLRADLPAGHWGKGKRLARVVWSGETDQVVVAGKLIAVRDAAALAEAEAEAEAEAKPVEEKPTEGEIARVR